MTTIALVNAGLSEESATARLGRAIEDALRARAQAPDLAIRWVDLRPLARAIADNLISGFPGPDLAQAIERVHAADGLVLLTPTYQASYSGLFKSFLDVLEDGTLAGKPVLIGATGGSARHSLITENAVRPVLIYMHADPVPTAVFAATEDWGAHAADSSGDEGSRLSVRIRRAADELLDRLAGARRSAVPPAADALRAAEPPSSIPDPEDPLASEHGTSLRDAYPGFIDFDTLRARGGLQ